MKWIVKFIDNFEKLKELGFVEYDNRYEIASTNPIARVPIIISKEDYKNGYAFEREAKTLSAIMTSRQEQQYLEKFLTDNNLEYVCINAELLEVGR